MLSAAFVVAASCGSRIAPNEHPTEKPSPRSVRANADSETSYAKRVKDYQAAEVYIMKFLPVVPYVHTKPALAFRKNVKGYVASPVSLESFATVFYSS